MGWQDRHYARDEASAAYRLGLEWPGPLATGVAVTALVISVLHLAMPVAWGREWASLWFPIQWRESWRWITFCWAHGSYWHLMFTLAGLYLFVTPLEALWGPLRAALFCACGVLVGVFSGWVTWRLSHAFGCALTGGAAGVLAAGGACAVLLPGHCVVIASFRASIRAIVVMLAVVLASLVAVWRDPLLASSLGGLAFGLAMARFGPAWLTRPRRAVAGRRSRQLLSPPDDREIDAILAQISRKGMQSLSARQRRMLEVATRRQSVR